ncbi:MAG: 50S ribosomal protein L10 [Pseudomonadota bacterium]
MDRAQKASELIHLKKRFKDDDIVLIVHYDGLTVAQVSLLRREMQSKGSSFKVTKNKLAALAVKGTRYEHLESLFKGPMAIASGQDTAGTAKALYEFAKKNDKLKILGGGLGETVLSKAAVEQLAKLPSLDELRAKLLGLLVAPATKIAGVVQAPAGQLARVVGAYANK